MSLRPWFQAVSLLLVFGTLAGCASTPQRWFLNGRSEAQFRQDDMECQALSRETSDAVAQGVLMTPPQSSPNAQIGVSAMGIFAVLAAEANAQASYRRCLVGRGYTMAK